MMKYILFIVGHGSGLDGHIPERVLFHGQSFCTRVLVINHALPYVLLDETSGIQEAPVMVVYQAPIMALLRESMNTIVTSQLVFTLRQCFPSTPLLILGFPATVIWGNLNGTAVKELESILKETIAEISNAEFLRLSCLWSLEGEKVPQSTLMELPDYSSEKKAQAMKKVLHCVRRSLFRNRLLGS